MKKFFLTTLAFFTLSSIFNVSAQAPLPFPQYFDKEGQQIQTKKINLK